MNMSRIRALPQPGGYHCREAFIQALITGDPELLLGGFTDLNINVGHEQMLRSVLKPFTRLPRERFEPVLDTGLDTNLAIRQLQKDGQAWLYVANPCQWHVSGHLLVDTPGPVVDLATGKPAEMVAQNGRQQLPIRLAPFGLCAYRIGSGQLVVREYQTQPLASADLARLQSVPRRVEDLLADPRARLSLSLADHRFMSATLDQVRQAIAQGQYAAAWSQLTHHRFWSRWQDFLERAVGAAAEPPGELVAGPGRISYEPDRSCIQVIGFSEEDPATMARLLAADGKQGWGKVTYEEACDTYTIDADLWIGDDKSTGTFLQIGTERHPQVTVVVKGTVWVRPPIDSPARSDGLASVINRLTLGDSENPHIRATLKIDCDRPAEHGLYVGFRGTGVDGTKAWISRGSLHVYNSTITAARQDRQHVWGGRDYMGENDSPRWASPGWYGSDVRLIGATISWFDGCVTYGVRTGQGDLRHGVDALVPSTALVIEDTTFEHGGQAVRNGAQYLKNCVLRDLQIAVAEGGSLGAKAVGCSFKNNRANWSLGGHSGWGIVLLDCQLEAPREAIAIEPNRVTAEQSARRGVPAYPACTVRQSLRVKVVDEAGTPVPDAAVMVSCAQDPGQVTRGATRTDDKGLTPADPERDAIVITTRIYRATDDPRAPEEKTFRYEVSVSAKSFRPMMIVLPAGQAIALPLEVRLRAGDH